MSRNNFPKTYNFITTFFISIKNGFYTVVVVVVATVTEFKDLS